MGDNYRVIVHIDLDAFYAQVEMRRLECDDDTPLCVQQWDGIIAVNYAARKFDISRHDRVDDVRRKCPHVRLVHVELIGGADDPASRNRTNSKVSLERYRVASQRIFKVLKRSVDRIERASIDEAFLDITELVNRRLAEAPDEVFAQQHSVVVGGVIDATLEFIAELRAQIRRELNYTTSAGVAHNKTLAKLASAMNKPNKQAVVPWSAVPALMADLPLRKLRYLGGKLGTEVLERLNVGTAGDVLRFSLTELSDAIGERSARFVYDIVRGVDAAEVVQRDKPKSMLAAKNVPAERTWEGVQRWMEQLAAELHERMMVDEDLNEREARNLVVTYRPMRAKASLSKTLRMPPEGATREARILHESMAALHRHAPSMLPVIFLGLTATNFVDRHPETQRLNRFFLPAAAAAAASAADGGKKADGRASGDGSASTPASAEDERCESDAALAQRLQEDDARPVKGGSSAAALAEQPGRNGASGSAAPTTLGKRRAHQRSVGALDAFVIRGSPRGRAHK